MIKRHPNTQFILAHFGWHANDLARAGKLLDENPNVYYDVAAVLYDFGRQPRAAHEFFVKYQDRILFGKDSYQPDEYPYYWRVFETNDEILRLLPRLSRVLEAVWHRPARPGAAASSITRTRCKVHARAVARRVHGLNVRGVTRISAAG